jgi:pimeloyl-ACP methyl ester carboxylesterase
VSAAICLLSFSLQLVFCDPKAVAARRACSRLATLPSSLPVHFVFADVGRSVLSEDEILKMLRFVPHATTARVEGAGHLIAQEKPAGTASEIVKFLRRVYPAKKSAKL